MINLYIIMTQRNIRWMLTFWYDSTCFHSNGFYTLSCSDKILCVMYVQKPHMNTRLTIHTPQSLTLNTIAGLNALLYCLYLLQCMCGLMRLWLSCMRSSNAVIELVLLYWASIMENNIHIIATTRALKLNSATFSQNSWGAQCTSSNSRVTINYCNALLFRVKFILCIHICITVITYKQMNRAVKSTFILIIYIAGIR